MSALFLLLLAQTEVGIAVHPDRPRTLDFAAQLSGELDVATAIHTSSVALDATLRGSLPDWPEPLLALFDPDGGRVVVARRADRTVLLRVLETSGSSYAAAIAAAELIRFARLPIPAKAEPLRSSLRPAFWVSLGIGIAESFGHEPLLFEPRLSIGAELFDDASGVFTGVALGVRAPVEATKNQISYRRWGPSVAFAAGWRTGRFRIGGSIAAGVGVTDARALDQAGSIEGRDTRAPAWALIGPFLEVELGVGLAAVVEAGFGASASPADYIVRNQVVLPEGRFRFDAALSLRWRWQGQ